MKTFEKNNILRRQLHLPVSKIITQGSSDTNEPCQYSRILACLDKMFVTNNDDILINEIAPRVHNSGHHTLQSSKTSQFEQHLRAILGLDLGDTTLLHNTIMYNILGPGDFQGEYDEPEISGDNVHLKMYGKKISKPSRKLGHFNLVGRNGQEIDELLEILDALKPDSAVRPRV